VAHHLEGPRRAQGRPRRRQRRHRDRARDDPGVLQRRLEHRTRLTLRRLPSGEVDVVADPGPVASAPGGPTTPVALGRLFGARSGDKGGNANVGVFARSDASWAWLDAYLSVDELRRLLPETASLVVDRHRLANLRSLNFVIHDLLEEGVAASTRQDAQAKGLGEWLRSRVVDVPTALLETA
jgi:hypothetical protein